MTSGDKFRVVQPRNDGSIRSTPLLDFDDIVRVKAVAHADIAEAEQVSNIGYTSVNTGNSITETNSNRYTLRLQFTNDTEIYSEQKDQYFFEYVSDATAKQIEIVDDFAQKMGKMKFADGSTVGAYRAKMAVERYSAASDSATASVTGTFTRGSDQVVFSGTHNVVVGDYIRQATGVGQPVYKCIEVVATDGAIVIDQPYQAASETTGSGDVKRIPVATAAAAAAGIKMTGLVAYHKVGLYPYSKVAFEFQLEGWGDTVSDTSTKPAKGNTVGEAVADMEWFAYSQDSPGGASFNGTGFPTAEAMGEAHAADASNYDLMVIEYATSGANQPHAIANGGKVKGTIVVAFVAGSAGNAADFEDLFNNATGAGTALTSD